MVAVAFALCLLWGSYLGYRRHGTHRKMLRAVGEYAIYGTIASALLFGLSAVVGYQFLWQPTTFTNDLTFATYQDGHKIYVQPESTEDGTSYRYSEGSGTDFENYSISTAYTDVDIVRDGRNEITTTCSVQKNVGWIEWPLKWGTTGHISCDYGALHKAVFHIPADGMGSYR